MSNDADFLSQAFFAISSRSADVDEKVDRLQRAKQAIIDEQSSCMSEIRLIREPSLNPQWHGSRGQKFDGSREEAYSTMESIINYDYEMKIRAIDGKITELGLQKGFLDTTRSLVHAADSLLDKGEEMVSELGNKIAEIKGRLFG